jgi:hypothetical protein
MPAHRCCHPHRPEVPRAFAVGAGNRNYRRRRLACKKLYIADGLSPRADGACDDRFLDRHTGTYHEQSRVAEDRVRQSPGMHRHTRKVAPEFVQIGRPVTRVHDRNLVAAGDEIAHASHSREPKAHYQRALCLRPCHCQCLHVLPSPSSPSLLPQGEKGASRRAQARLHFYRIFNVASPINTRINEIIQKRTITRGSGQPFSSKW